MTTDDATRLLEIVEQMRAAQRAYFKDRTHGALEDSKRLEKQCDKLITEIRQAEAGQAQPNLFGE